MPQNSRSQRFNHPITGPLSMNVVVQVAAKNARIAGSPDEHQAEALVQGMMRELLIPYMPCPTLIAENEEVLRPPGSGGYIPDLIVRTLGNAGSGYWGFFELKTLLKDDELKVREVERDLMKLCAYKEAFPDAAAVFILVGSWKRLFSDQRRASFERLPIRYDLTLWDNVPPAPQILDESYVAIPVSACAIEKMGIACLMWEIQSKAASTQALSSTYDFVAEML